MKYRKELTVVVLFLMTSLGHAYSQQTSVTSGGEGSGTGGSLSYSIGQVLYRAVAGSEYNITNGVQQAYEVYEIVANDEEIDVSIHVFPNPTNDQLTLEAGDPNNLSYELYDLQGRSLSKHAITNLQTHIDVLQVAGTYILKVMKSRRTVKLFKVIRN